TAKANRSAALSASSYGRLSCSCVTGKSCDKWRGRRRKTFAKGWTPLLKRPHDRFAILRAGAARPFALVLIVINRSAARRRIVVVVLRIGPPSPRPLLARVVPIPGVCRTLIVLIGVTPAARVGLLTVVLAAAVERCRH